MDPVLRRVWRRSDKDLFLRRSSQGLSHVENGTADAPTAFVVDSDQAKRMMEDRCDLATVGDLGKRYRQNFS